LVERTIEELSVASSWQGLIEFCESSLGTSNGGVPPDVQNRLLLGLFMGRFYIGDLAGAESLAPTLHETVRTTDDRLFTADAKYQLGLFYKASGTLDRAEEELNESYVFYKHAESIRGAIKALNLLAGTAYARGKLDRAEEYLETCRDFARQIDSERRERAILRNLARVYTVSGRLKDALDIFSELDSEVYEPSARIQSMLSIARIHMMFGDFEKCNSSLDRCADLIEGGEFGFEYRLLNEYRGIACHEFGNQERAERYLKAVVAMPDSTPSARAQSKRVLVDVYLALDRLEEAAVMAESADEELANLGEKIELGVLRRSQGTLASLTGEFDRARSSYLESVSILSGCGARYELAKTYDAMAATSAFDNAVSRRYRSLAALLFDEMGVNIQTMMARPYRTVLRKSEDNGSSDSKTVPNIVFASSRMKDLLGIAGRVGVTEMRVLLTGPTGSGKDLLARYIHYVSGRKGKLVTVNAAAIPNDMVEAELFGYCKGAFTGATSDKAGLLETADGGTFYLNEIADASAEFQTKLLEVIETKLVRRLGSNEGRKIDFRLVSATNQKLEDLIDRNRFRLDLFHRLSEFPLDVPSLAARKSDIPVLVKHFLSRCSSVNGIDPEDVSELGRVLTRRAWPGNVRELEAEIKRLWITSEGDVGRMARLASEDSRTDERTLLVGTLSATNWNRRETARRLGISEATIRNRIKKYQLSEPQ